MEEISHRPTRAPGDDGLRTALETAGHRFTPQRGAVFRALYASRAHPTADELFTSVRREIPDISLATVYKALEAFVGAGLAARLICGDGPARYDSRMDAHHHITCVACGKVVDVDDPGLDEPLRSLGARSEFDIHDYRLVLLGTCPSCRS